MPTVEAEVLPTAQPTVRVEVPQAQPTETQQVYGEVPQAQPTETQVYGEVPIAQPTMTPEVVPETTMPISKVDCAYELGKVMEFRNVSMVFRPEKCQKITAKISDFCTKRGWGLHCYQSAKATDCMSLAMILCPDGVVVRCKKNYACVQPDPWFAGECRMIDELPQYSMKQKLILGPLPLLPVPMAEDDLDSSLD